MTTHRLFWSAIVLIAIWPTHNAQSPPSASLLSRLQGSWHGPGKAFGMDAQLRMHWEPVLGNKFARLTLKNEMRTPNGQTQAFEGHAYYQLPKNATDYNLVARWFDSRGVSFPIKASIEGESLVALWGSPDQEEGKSVYRFIEPGKLEVVDSVKQKDGTWREFGRFVVTKE